MSYTPPAGDAVIAQLQAGSYTPPAGDAVIVQPAEQSNLTVARVYGSVGRVADIRATFTAPKDIRVAAVSAKVVVGAAIAITHGAVALVAASVSRHGGGAGSVPYIEDDDGLIRWKPGAPV